MNKKQTLNIYVLNWNQAELTRDCVNSLLNQSAPVRFELFIIDNGSSDNSVEIFKHTFSGIGILENKTNLGFQGGMNTGIKHAILKKADYILLLNNDTVADPTMLENLFKFMPSDAVLVSPAIYYHSDHDILCSLGGNFHPVLLEVLGKPNSFYSPPKTVKKFEFLPSHAWLMKTEIINTIGMFDERFFPIYYDDLDFCLRLKRLQYSLYLIPQAKIYHRESMSVGGRNSPNERYLMARNSGFYFRKNMRIWQAPFIFCFRLGSGFLWTFRLLSQKNLKAIKGYWRGFIDGWFKKMPKA